MSNPTVSITLEADDATKRLILKGVDANVDHIYDICKDSYLALYRIYEHDHKRVPTIVKTRIDIQQLQGQVKGSRSDMQFITEKLSEFIWDKSKSLDNIKYLLDTCYEIVANDS